MPFLRLLILVGLVIRFVTEPSASRSPIVSAGASAEPEVLLKLPLDTAGGLEASIANPVVLQRVLPGVLSTDPALTVGNPTSAALLFRAPEVVIWDCDVEGKSEPLPVRSSGRIYDQHFFV